MFAFNEGLDGIIVRPVAKGYEMVVPSPIRTGVANFFANIADIVIGGKRLVAGQAARSRQ